MEEPSFTIERIINGLQSEEKATKKKSLDELGRRLQGANNEELRELYSKFFKMLVSYFNDNTEVCREKAIGFTRDFIEKLDNEDMLLSLMPAVHRRLANDHFLEGSEEIRLQLLQLLGKIIDKFEKQMPPYIESAVEILVRTIVDPAPLVKRESCSCVIRLSKVAPWEFYKYSPRLVNPLNLAMSHQHWRVRVAVVEATGAVMNNGDNKSVPDMTGQLAKRLFDASDHVRMAVTRVVGDWLVNLKDRYSFFSNLLPLMLTCLTDEKQEIVEEAEKLWLAAGAQYLQENEEDNKDRINFLPEKLDHYPQGVRRPSLGCRILLEREASKFLLALGKELGDWIVSVRVKSAQLLCQVILHDEMNITQQIEKIFKPMCKAAMDEEPFVVEHVMRAAEYVGYFVPAEVYCNLIVNHIAEANYGELRIISSIIKGTKREDLEPFMGTIAPLLSSSTFKAEEQYEILALIEALFNTSKEDCLVIGKEIWSAIINNLGLATQERIADKGLKLLDEFVGLTGEDKTSTSNKYCGLVIGKLLKETCWAPHCHEQFILAGIANYAGEVIGGNLDDFMIILDCALGPETDAEVVLKVVMVTNTILLENKTTLPTEELLQKFVNHLVLSILQHQLTWHAGRSAEATRTAAASCLYTALSFHVPSEIRTILPILISLIEDPSPKTRLLASKTIIVTSSHLVSDRDDFSKLTQAVLKRLDDCDAKIRFSAVECLKTLYSEILKQQPKEDCDMGLLEFAYGTLLIHLDDQQKAFQLKVLDCLKVVCVLNVDLLMSKICVSNFRDREICQELVNFINKNN